MTKKKQNSKEIILETACELFAKYGYRSVSTRMIAKTANVPHGSIHYHFGGKDQLYYEVFKQIINPEKACTYLTLQEKEPHVFNTNEGKAYAIQRVVYDYMLRHVFQLESWKQSVIFKELFDNSPIFLKVVDDILKVESELMYDFYFLLKPDGSEADAYYWSHFPDSQGLYYQMCWPSIQEYRGPEFMSTLRERVIIQTIKTMITLVDLPLPEMWRETKKNNESSSQ